MGIRSYEIVAKWIEMIICCIFLFYSRMGPKGRKSLVDNWAQYLPLYTHTESINPQATQKEPAEKVAKDVSCKICRRTLSKQILY